MMKLAFSHLGSSHLKCAQLEGEELEKTLIYEPWDSLQEQPEQRDRPQEAINK